MMKRTLFLLAAFAIGCSAMAQAVIKFDKEVHDFGKFNKDKVQNCEFVFTNTGDKPLVIQQAYGSCGCTVPSAPKDPIAPGEKGVIKVRYNGASMFKGSMRKMISVRSNATNSLVRLYIKGVMEDKE